MKNKEIIKREIEKQGFTLGCWDNSMEHLSKKYVDMICSSFVLEDDIDVFIKRKLHVVEISIVDNEVDFSVLTKEEYINRYGDERWYEE